ncbi:MAG: DUF5060 domain-containing protein [candidate division KSB1 bacterium]|nr:DUF5060 domain-containing protein [candidate division KSB1 bacterium]
MKHLIKSFWIQLIITTVLFAAEHVERWGLYEITLQGPRSGNPFTDVQLSADFRNAESIVTVHGFYDGDGVYKIRFMPEKTGTWSWHISSTVEPLDGKTGEMVCIPVSDGNHGPVRVHNTFHFAYTDGTPYKQIGTTCYAWIHQTQQLQEQTLKTLSESAFNKIRMCIFPKDYVYNQNEPGSYAFVRDQSGKNDYSRFDPAFWAHLEQRILDLQNLGIQADLILFHPYDRWDFANMTDEQDDFYLKYALARLSAFRNVWWSLANEFDFMTDKDMADWDRFYKIITENDPYDHLRGIHNGRIFYDHSKPWVTHCSIQSSDFSRIQDWQQLYQKPILYDESRYEGNIPQGWGNITAQEMTDRFWKAAAAGCYMGHGETYKHPDDILWWSKGGVLHGQSPARIAFFKQIFDETPAEGLCYIDSLHAGVKDRYYLWYFSTDTPDSYTFKVPPYLEYKVDIIDAWNMNIKPVKQPYFDSFTLDLPNQPYIAVRVRAVDFNFPAPPVAVSPQSSLFIDKKTVQLAHKSGDPVYYTLDGSVPSVDSPRYRQPIIIFQDGVQLKTVCIDAKGRSSKLKTVTYEQTRPLPSVQTENRQPGIRCKLYNGEWEMLPRFAELEPVDQGVSAQIDLSPQQQPDNFGIVYEGLINIPATDIYKFATHSDDGTKLWIDGQQVVNNDGDHAPLLKSGEIGLEKGYHTIRVEFYEHAGDEVLEVFWQSSSRSREIIPQNMLFHEP